MANGGSGGPEGGDGKAGAKSAVQASFDEGRKRHFPPGDKEAVLGPGGKADQLKARLEASRAKNRKP